MSKRTARSEDSRWSQHGGTGKHVREEGRIQHRGVRRRREYPISASESLYALFDHRLGRGEGISIEEGKRVNGDLMSTVIEG